ncbi:hypothetical protein A2U01_0049944, partial [Trifolium medium]|nr:hypothetical protein [Trifolium medium]
TTGQETSLAQGTTDQETSIA